MSNKNSATGETSISRRTLIRAVTAAIEGRYGGAVDSMTIRTNQRSSERFGGPGGGQGYIYEAPPGAEIIGFWGIHGTHGDDPDVITAIGVFFRAKGA